MNRRFILTTCIWGFLLWLVGYILGILLFAVVPHMYIGWIIMPIGICVTIWVLKKKIPAVGIRDYLILSTIWTVLAIILDYVFLVRVFKPADGYYKTDVYLYYVITFILPLFFFRKKKDR